MIPTTSTRKGNLATKELGLTQTNADVSLRMSQAPERQSSLGTQSRTQTEAEGQTQQEIQTRPEAPKVLRTQDEPGVQTKSWTQAEPEIGNESAVRDGIITQVRLATEIKPQVDAVEPRPEAEITTGNTTSDIVEQ